MVAVMESMIFGKPLSYIKKLIEEDEARTPAPEVDEAAVWTRKVFQAIYKLPDSDRGHEGGAPFNRVRAYLRTALSELIASKNAEIERLRNVAKVNCDIANDCASELAALRAENKRLRITLDDAGIDVDQWIKCERAAGNAPSPKAAERNTAEPIPASIHTEAPSALADRVGTSADTAPVVEATQIDLDLFQKLHGVKATSRIDHLVTQRYAQVRTEAEARGRRVVEPRQSPARR